MSFTGAHINKAQGGLMKGEGVDRIAVLVVGTNAVSGKLELNKAYEILQIEDVERLGIAAGSMEYYHVSEVFRLSPETKIYLIAVGKSVKVSELGGTFVTAIRGIDGVNTIAIAGVIPDIDIKTAVTAAQTIVDNLAKDYIYIDNVLLEGVGRYLAGQIVAYQNLRELASPNVSVIIGQDVGMCSVDPHHSAVGSALGMLMCRAVHENLGSVDIEVKPRGRKTEGDYTLSDKKLGRFMLAGLSNGKLFSALSQADQKKLNELGYIYVGGFNGYGGYFFSNSHTCTEADNDYSFIERNAIWNKAARIIRNTLIPRIRSKVEADPNTGFIASTTIGDWDARVRKALEVLVNARNIADFDVFIDPSQVAVSTDPFEIKIKLVADGIVHEFEIDLGFTNKI